MNNRSTPETDAVKFPIGDGNHFAVHVMEEKKKLKQVPVVNFEIKLEEAK